MKQNIMLSNGTASEAAYGTCLTGFTMRWALFGVLMWWLSSIGHSHGGSQMMTWLIGIAAGFALARRDFRP